MHKITQYFHIQNLVFIPFGSHPNFLTNLPSEDSSLLSQQSHIINFYRHSGPDFSDCSFCVLLKIQTNFVYLSSAVAYLCNSQICNGEPENPVTIYFSRLLDSSQIAKVTDFILANLFKLYPSYQLYLSLYPFSETIIKPFKRYFDASTTQLLPLAGRYISLLGGYDHVRSNFRKSVKPLINQTLRNFHLLSSHNSESPQSLFADYKNLHFEAAGRLTRSHASWQVQLDMLTDNTAFLVVLYQHTTPVGSAYFVPEGPILHYWSGAYNRNFTTTGLGHAAVDYAINWACQKKFDSFNFGLPQYIQDNISTTKRKRLAHFRQAFSSSLQVGANLLIDLSQTS